jgi:hypothetical protein
VLKLQVRRQKDREPKYLLPYLDDVAIIKVKKTRRRVGLEYRHIWHLGIKQTLAIRRTLSV